MHKRDQESTLIATLLEGHTITSACKRAGVSRMFYDRHYKNDRGFRKQVDEARAAGKDTNNDLITTMYFKKARDGHWPAIHYGLKKQEASEVKDSESLKGLVTVGDIRHIIDLLPESVRPLHNDHLRELLDHLAEFERTGKIMPPHPDGL
ncbi:MAG: hypothetical protein P4M11_05675 [Candidatus Pacebacteria bacterium]|nr:hypothetical protein [Candidatus Paceibacterota bacterium]